MGISWTGTPECTVMVQGHEEPGPTKEAQATKLGRCCVRAPQRGRTHIWAVMKLEAPKNDSILLHCTGANTNTPLL